MAVVNDADLAPRAFDGHVVRYLAAGDYDKGFLELLGQLTTVGDVSREAFAAQIERRAAQSTITVVVENVAAGKIVATGSLVVEYKFIHACSAVGHIEDVVVDASVRGARLGSRIVDALKEESVRRGCYKVILDAAASNAKFYENNGFRQCELQLRCDLPATMAEYRKTQST